MDTNLSSVLIVAIPATVTVITVLLSTWLAYQQLKGAVALVDKKVDVVQVDVGAVVKKVDMVSKEVAHVKDLTNSQSQLLLEVTEQAAHAKGKQEERVEERARTKAEEVAPNTDSGAVKLDINVPKQKLNVEQKKDTK